MDVNYDNTKQIEFLHIYESYSEPERVVLLGAHCPACDFEHSFRVDEEYWAREGKGVWTFNGDYKKPTFRASMLSRNPKNTRRCHSYLEEGRWRFLDDCTHELVGQTVDMVPIKNYNL